MRLTSGSMFVLTGLLLLSIVATCNSSLAACSPPAKIVGGDGYNPTSIQDAYDYANLTLGLSEFTLQLSGEIFSEDLFLDQGTVTLDGGYDCSFTSKTGAPTGIYGKVTVSSGAANFASDIAIVSTDKCDFDRDLDGFTSLGSCLGSADDCNDLDPAISPGASELCDGIDNNCDGQIDEGFAPVDADGDGYFGFDACGVVANDCNDADATIHPDALDIPYDGIDQDCNGVDLTFDGERCLFCHTDPPPSAWPGLHDLTTVPDASCAGCHAPIVTSLATGHYGRTVLTDGNAMTAGMVIGCESCHDPNSGFHNWGTNTVWPKVKAVTPNISCDTCHESRAAGHVSVTAHDNRLSDPVCGPCHTSGSVAEVDTLHRSDCLLCHNYTGTAVNPETVREVILQGVTGTPVGCNDCHNKGDDHLNHDHSATISISADCLSCHDNPQIVAGTHNNGCALCHSSTRPEVEAAIDSGQAECIDCHNAHDHSTVTGTADCAGCHFSGDPLAVDIVPIHNSSCALCHNSTRQEVIDTIASGQGECIDCHSPHGDLAVAHNNLSAPNSCAVCHTDKLTGTDFAYIINYHANPNLGFTEIEKCLRCHDSTRPEVFSTIAAGKGVDGVPVTCANCHVSQHVPIIMPSAIHNFILTNYGSNCYNCHIENYWTHTDMVATNGCGNCHASANQDEYNALHQNDCLVCHLSERAEVISTIYAGVAGTTVECVDCHGTLEDVHGNVNHNASPGSAPVAIFADYTHDDAAWAYGQPAPHFDIMVDCSICHTIDLPKAHGNDCSTCHPSPYDTLGTWQQGCQQGGCHTTIHEDIAPSHDPYEDAYDPGNDCSVCHSQDWSVPQTNCLNCHAASSAGDSSPPTTTADVQAEYLGAALIDFSIQDNGKLVGMGRTFYQLNGSDIVAAGKKLLITTPGDYELQFWSIDQAGNTEVAVNTENFTILEDTTPPVTTSNAQPTYTSGTTITLTATDANTLGVKATYYSLNGGATHTGTQVAIPGPIGVNNYTLSYWSEDWSGNVEATNTVNFTVDVPPNATIRLIWWDADINPAHQPIAGESMNWTIKQGTTTVSTGSRNGPWDGVDDITLQVSATPYTVIVTYAYWQTEDFLEVDGNTFNNQYLTTADQVIELHY